MEIMSEIVNNCIEAISVKYNNIVYERKIAEKETIVLSLGEAFFDLPLLPFDTLAYPDIYHYSHSRGIIELRNKIAHYYSNFGVKVNAEKEVIISAGSKLSIYMIFKALLNPGDEVIIQEPAWVSYSEQVKLCYSKVISVPHYENVLDIEQYITPKTKIVVINNPNNPTGEIYTQKQLEHLVCLSKKYNFYIISDEAYSDFIIGEKFNSIGKLDPIKENVIICNSLSKNIGISGWRIGYSITNEKLTNNLLKLNQHILTCAPTILQHYVNNYFHDLTLSVKPQIQALLKTREILSEYLRSIKLHRLPGTATFYFFISIEPSLLSSNDFCFILLNEYNISTVPGIGYGSSCNKFIRVSFGTEPIKKIKYALNKIKFLIEKTSAG